MRDERLSTIDTSTVRINHESESRKLTGNNNGRRRSKEAAKTETSTSYQQYHYRIPQEVPILVQFSLGTSVPSLFCYCN